MSIPSAQAQSDVDSPTASVAVRALLIALLPIIALAIYLDGQVYDADRIELTRDQSGLDDRVLPADIVGLERFGGVRYFDAETLYEYINGHAEYFISAGFNGLAVFEYGQRGADSPALVANAYDMGAPLNAFGVLVDEAGEQEPVDVGTMGFTDGGGLSFIDGPYYIQIGVFSDDIDVVSAARAIASALETQVAEAGLDLDFPDFGAKVTTRFVKEYYRGLDFLENVLERTFDYNGKELVAFMVNDKPAGIEKLVDEFEAFFAYDEMPWTKTDVGGITLYRVDDPYEGPWAFWVLKTRIIGVYGAPDDRMIERVREYAVEENDNG